VRDHAPVLFELREVSLNRGERRVLDAVDADIHPGATAIVGPSGAGKSTLLRLLNRLADPDAGTIAYRGRALAEYDPLLLRREVSLVPQLPSLLPGTVESNLAYAARLAGKRLDAAACLGHAGLGAEFAARDVAELSVGERQRTMLARALAQQADVVLLDEPFTGIDVKTEEAIVKLLRSMRDEGRVILVSTHNLGSVPEFCDRTVLVKGTVLAYGPTDETFTRANLEAAFGGVLRHFVLGGQDLHDDEDQRQVHVLTDDERPFVIYEEGDRKDGDT